MFKLLTFEPKKGILLFLSKIYDSRKTKKSRDQQQLGVDQIQTGHSSWKQELQPTLEAWLSLPSARVPHGLEHLVTSKR